MRQLAYFILQGLFYGYSKEAIHAYIIRRTDLENLAMSTFTPTSNGTPFEGTGFIPSARELAMSYEEVTSEVNSRRICSQPFPSDDPCDEEFEAFFEDPSEDVKNLVVEVLLYLKENTYESYLRANAERRSRGDIPVR